MAYLTELNVAICWLHSKCVLSAAEVHLFEQIQEGMVHIELIMMFTYPRARSFQLKSSTFEYRTH